SRDEWSRRGGDPEDPIEHRLDEGFCDTSEQRKNWVETVRLLTQLPTVVRSQPSLLPLATQLMPVAENEHIHPDLRKNAIIGLAELAQRFSKNNFSDKETAAQQHLAEVFSESIIDLLERSLQQSLQGYDGENLSPSQANIVWATLYSQHQLLDLRPSLSSEVLQGLSELGRRRRDEYAVKPKGLMTEGFRSYHALYCIANEILLSLERDRKSP
ncbi:hypothetical protein MRY87_08050, partial [bacterium]|nr:hypothetical protein [bacterium]